MAHVVSIHANGGPEVLRYEEQDVADPGPKELRIRQSRCGVNFIDTYVRSGLYPTPLPFVLGQEGVGEVLSVGAEVIGFQPGDRVTYSTMAGGGYASERVIAADDPGVVYQNIDITCDLQQRLNPFCRTEIGNGGTHLYAGYNLL